MTCVRSGSVFAALIATLSLVACGGAAAADCGGHNGNAAVAACHPDNDEIQAACPDNSNGENYATPDDSCLEAARSAGP
jgi:hypothetical protein